MMQSKKKWHTCTGCGKNLSSYRSLWRHKKNCRQASGDVHTSSISRDRSPVLSRASNTPTSSVVRTQSTPHTFGGGVSGGGAAAASAVDRDSSGEKRPTNPKIQALLNAIINDDDNNDPKRHVKPARVIHEGFSIVPPTTTSHSSKRSRLLTPGPQSALTTREEPGIKKIKLSSPAAARSKEDIKNLPQPKHVEYSDTDSDAESPVDDSDGDDGDDDDEKMHHPRTKGQIIGYEDDEQEQHIEKQIPDDAEDLEDRFNHLLIEYTREKKAESGQELAMLLDIMLDRGLVTAVEYSKLNSLIAPPPAADEDETDASDKEEKEEEEAEGELGRIVKETVDYVTRLDREELSDLLMELRDEVGNGELLDVLIDLDLLAGKFLENEFDDGVLLLPLIEEKRLALEVSPASSSKLLRMKILLDDLQNNRHRIQEIFQRIDDAENNEGDIWKILVREGLISDEQFEELENLENTEIEKISSILKSTKSGQGISFLPTTMSALRYTFGQLWKTGVKNKILPVLKELLRRGGMTDEQYSILLNELDKL